MRDIADPGPRRRYSARPFPAYRFVPALRPHPNRDPEGHSYEAVPRRQRHAPWSPEDWRALDDWLFGVDLFNAHYFWEAHEAWEGLWAACPRDSIPALFVQGLIQVAAALLKAHLGSAAGVRSLSGDGLEKLRQVAASEPRFMGLDLPRTIRELETFFAAGDVPSLAAAPVLDLAFSFSEKCGV